MDKREMQIWSSLAEESQTQNRWDLPGKWPIHSNSSDLQNQGSHLQSVYPFISYFWGFFCYGFPFSFLLTFCKCIPFFFLNFFLNFLHKGRMRSFSLPPKVRNCMCSVLGCHISSYIFKPVFCELSLAQLTKTGQPSNPTENCIISL